ncbi:MAG: hypothetical protein ABI866_11860 [Dokdonella sp.]
MKQTFVLGTIPIALLLVSACANSGNTRYATEQKFVVDQQYVDAVNHASRQAGVRVTWVNPPTKRVPAGGDTSN